MRYLYLIKSPAPKSRLVVIVYQREVTEWTIELRGTLHLLSDVGVSTSFVHSSRIHSASFVCDPVEKNITQYLVSSERHTVKPLAYEQHECMTTAPFALTLRFCTSHCGFGDVYYN